MRDKKLSQFMCDYFKDGETIEVDCNWLQKQLRELEQLKRDRLYLNNRLSLLEALKAISEPNYKLDIKG